MQRRFCTLTLKSSAAVCESFFRNMKFCIVVESPVCFTVQFINFNTTDMTFCNYIFVNVKVSKTKRSFTSLF